MIQSYKEWLRMDEGLRITSDFIDHRPLQVITRIWRNKAEIDEVFRFYHFAAIVTGEGSEVAKVYFDSERVRSIGDNSTAAVANRFDSEEEGIRYRAIYLSTEVPLFKKRTDIVYHELMHTLSKKPISPPTKNIYQYLSDPEEISSFMGQLYMVAAAIASDPQKRDRMKDLLRRGETEEIFQMADKLSHREEEIQIHQRVHQLYFGGKDQKTIDALKNLDLGFPIEKGIFSVMKNGEKMRKKFLSSLNQILETKGKEVTVLLHPLLYQMLQISGNQSFPSVESWEIEGLSPKEVVNNLFLEEKSALYDCFKFEYVVQKNEVLDTYLRLREKGFSKITLEEIEEWYRGVEKKFPEDSQSIFYSIWRETKKNTQKSIPEVDEYYQNHKDPKDPPTHEEFVSQYFLKAFQKIVQLSKRVFAPRTALQKENLQLLEESYSWGDSDFSNSPFRGKEGLTLKVGAQKGELNQVGKVVHFIYRNPGLSRKQLCQQLLGMPGKSEAEMYRYGGRNLESVISRGLYLGYLLQDTQRPKRWFARKEKTQTLEEILKQHSGGISGRKYGL